MDADSHETPQKLKTTSWWSNLPNGKQDAAAAAVCTKSGGSTPISYRMSVYQPHTPGKCSIAGKIPTSQLLSASLVGTPPAKRFNRVRNPFETTMADRLHLPLIASPLFQRPTTPQLSSTQFEWTIDEVSSLKPAHVEPHETQFHDSPDPEYEAKAQSAISSFFKEQQIVPSPIDCPLRNYRIVLSDLDRNTPITKPGRRIRDCGTQTELTLPFDLPKELEDALRPYFQPHLAYSSRIDVGEDSFGRSKGGDTSDHIKDISLRRKLFDMHNIVVLDGANTPVSNRSAKTSLIFNSNHSPNTSRNGHQHTAINGKLSDSLDKSSFGSLSPISSVTDGVSISSNATPPDVKESATKRKSRLQRFLFDLDDVEQLSPIHPPKPKRAINRKKSISHMEKIPPATVSQSKNNYRQTMNTTEQTVGDDTSSLSNVNIEKFTLDRSSSPLRCFNATEMSVDSSINNKISRLGMNTSNCFTKNNLTRTRLIERSNIEIDNCSRTGDDTDDITMEMDDDDMQVSQLSAQSNSSNSDTPRSKRRSASRKNLSRSFSTNWLDVTENEEVYGDVVATDDPMQKLIKLNIPKINEMIVIEEQVHAATVQVALTTGQQLDKLSADNDDQRSTFYRTDSGFNDMTTCPSSVSSSQQDAMETVRCSTPSIVDINADTNY